MDATTLDLLDGFQRDFPLCPRPFDRVARRLGRDVDWVVDTLRALRERGAISRVGPVFRPNTVGASTLAAIAVPSAALERTARAISAFEAVNHNYEREHAFNLWFVATAADAAALERTLDTIERRVDRPLLRLPLLRDYHIDLGFALGREGIAAHPSVSGIVPGTRSGGATLGSPPSPAARTLVRVATGPPRRDRDDPGAQVACGPASSDAIAPTAPSRASARADRDAVIAALQRGLPLRRRPYRVAAARAGLDEDALLAEIRAMIADGSIRRFGVVVRHRELGYRANAMAVWNVPDARVDGIGERLATEPAVTLCYHRPRVPPHWPYNLFCMVHGRDRGTVRGQLAAIAARHGLGRFGHEVLFSRRRFKQRGAVYRPDERAAS